MIYKVEFEGTVRIEAESEAEAEAILERNITFCLNCEYFACEAHTPTEGAEDNE